MGIRTALAEILAGRKFEPEVPKSDRGSTVTIGSVGSDPQVSLEDALRDVHRAMIANDRAEAMRFMPYAMSDDYARDCMAAGFSDDEIQSHRRLIHEAVVYGYSPTIQKMLARQQLGEQLRQQKSQQAWENRLLRRPKDRSDAVRQARRIATAVVTLPISSFFGAGRSITGVLNPFEDDLQGQEEV